MGFALRGVFWLQGDRDVAAAPGAYGCRLRALISSWRDRWGIGEFAFVAVEAAPGASAALPAFRAAGLLGDDLTLITELGNYDLDKLGVRLGDRRRLRQAFEARGDGSS